MALYRVRSSKFNARNKCALRKYVCVRALLTPPRLSLTLLQACEQCRQRKQKCDEGVPCSFCKENSLTCAYRDTPPAKCVALRYRADDHLTDMHQNRQEHGEITGSDGTKQGWVGSTN